MRTDPDKYRPGTMTVPQPEDEEDLGRLQDVTQGTHQAMETLAGRWIGGAGGLHLIDKSYVHWGDGNVSKLRTFLIAGVPHCATTVHGFTYRGELKAGRIHWSDGDIWIRDTKGGNQGEAPRSCSLGRTVGCIFGGIPMLITAPISLIAGAFTSTTVALTSGEPTPSPALPAPPGSTWEITSYGEVPGPRPHLVGGAGQRETHTGHAESYVPHYASDHVDHGAHHGHHDHPAHHQREHERPYEPSSRRPSAHDARHEMRGHSPADWPEREPPMPHTTKHAGHAAAGHAAAGHAAASQAPHCEPGYESAPQHPAAFETHTSRQPAPYKQVPPEPSSFWMDDGSKRAPHPAPLPAQKAAVSREATVSRAPTDLSATSKATTWPQPFSHSATPESSQPQPDLQGSASPLRPGFSMDVPLTLPAIPERVPAWEELSATPASSARWSLLAPDQKPDFSGRWTCFATDGDVEAFLETLGGKRFNRFTALAQGYGVGGAARNIEQTGDELSVSLEGFNTRELRLHIGGSEVRAETPQGDVWVKAVWEGSSLRCGFRGDDGSARPTQRYFFQGETLVLEATGLPTGGTAKFLLHRA